MCVRSALALACLAVLAAPSLAKGPIDPFQVGNWQVGSYTNDMTGTFSHCTASETFPSGHYLVIAMGSNRDWSIGLYYSAWRLRRGLSIPVTISFDGVGPFQFTGLVGVSNAIWIPMPETDVATEAFRAALQMHLTIFGTVLNFDLTSTFDLLPALKNCIAGSSRSPPDWKEDEPTPNPADKLPKFGDEEPNSRDEQTANIDRENGASLSGEARRILVPLQVEGRTFVVPVTINGQLTLNFILDTGASDVSIPGDVVLTLVRTGTITKADFLGEQKYQMADGTSVPSQRFVIRSLKVGDRLLENVTGSVAPVAGSLLLGQSFLTRFKSWSIDNQKRALILE
jgi:hypothetical protein